MTQANRICSCLIAIALCCAAQSPATSEQSKRSEQKSSATSSAEPNQSAGEKIRLVGTPFSSKKIVVRGDARIRESMALADNTASSNQTYTAAQLVGGIITRDPNGGARTDTTATGTEIETELNAQGIDVATGDTFTCLIVNTANGAEAITIGGGTGVAISNAGQTIAQNESALLLFRRTGANAFTCYILGA